MHPSVMAWCRAVVALYRLNRGRVLEVGSFDVNGSVRPLFDRAEVYVGVDIRPGPGVDVVVDPDTLEAGVPLAGADVVISTEMLEHCQRPWLTVPAMARALVDGGHLVVTTRGFGYGEHDYPSDFWRYNDQSIRLLLVDAGLEVLEISHDPDVGSPGVFAVARKP